MNVVKRDGHSEPVMFDKITARVRKLCYGLNTLVDPVKVAMRTPFCPSYPGDNKNDDSAAALSADSEAVTQLDGGCGLGRVSHIGTPMLQPACE